MGYSTRFSPSLQKNEVYFIKVEIYKFTHHDIVVVCLQKRVSRVASTKMFIDPDTKWENLNTICVLCLCVWFRTLIMVVNVITYGPSVS